LQPNNFDSDGDCDPDSDADLLGRSFLFSEQKSSKFHDSTRCAGGTQAHENRRNRYWDRHCLLQPNNFDSDGDCDPDSDADLLGRSFLFSEQKLGSAVFFSEPF
jgi:hypothetical protein